MRHAATVVSVAFLLIYVVAAQAASCPVRQSRCRFTPESGYVRCLAIERERGSVEAIYCGRSLLCRPTFGAEAREAQT